MKQVATSFLPASTLRLREQSHDVSPTAQDDRHDQHNKHDGSLMLKTLIVSEGALSSATIDDINEG